MLENQTLTAARQEFSSVKTYMAAKYDSSESSSTSFPPRVQQIIIVNKSDNKLLYTCTISHR